MSSVITKNFNYASHCFEAMIKTPNRIPGDRPIKFSGIDIEYLIETNLDKISGEMFVDCCYRFTIGGKITCWLNSEESGKVFDAAQLLREISNE